MVSDLTNLGLALAGVVVGIAGLVVAIVAYGHSRKIAIAEEEKLKTPNVSVLAMWLDGNGKNLGAYLFFTISNNRPVPVSVHTPLIETKRGWSTFMKSAVQNPRQHSKLLHPNESWDEYIKDEEILCDFTMMPTDMPFRLVFQTTPHGTFKSEWLEAPDEAIPFLTAPLSEVEGKSINRDLNDKLGNP